MEVVDGVYVCKHKDSLQKGNGNIRYHFWQNKRVGPHVHDHFEFFIVTENRLAHIFNEEETVLEKGMLCLLRPGDIHQLHAYQNEPCQHFNLAVSSQVFEELCRFLSPSLYSSIMQESGLICYKLQVEEFAFFNHLVNKTNQIPTLSSPMAMTVTQTFLLYVQAYLLAQQRNDATWPQWFTEFLEKISAPTVFCQPLSAIYPLSPYSQTRLNTLFHQYTNSTLIEYITKQRINYACNLLISTNYKAAHVASLVGFGSVSAFNHVFKKVTSLTPIQYKKSRVSASS